MRSNIFIPKQIKVGFQNRDDTYTKKLAYIIYYDEKKKLRKENSWNSWRDDKIEPKDFENVPTEGFVLNKKVGDYCCDWNHRQAYVRVYDPRDFEFEITVENLLYILENASSIKGKGLEGQFIYGWDGKDLLLMPIDAPDYKEITKYNKLVFENNHIKGKDLKLGATYKRKDNSEWVYLGRFDYWTIKYDQVPVHSDNWYTRYKSIPKDINKGKYYYFGRFKTYSWDKGVEHLDTLILKSLGNAFIGIVSDECSNNYADLIDKLEHTTNYSPLDKSKDEYIKYTLEEFKNKLKDTKWGEYVYNQDYKEIEIRKDEEKQNMFYYYDSDGKIIEGVLEEFYYDIEPMYKNIYLKNGKLYKGGK